ncbi:hypothetical protein [Peredibacter starrii]|uniref:Uncharacterized protein n=1 Tax=Peredibacter starrii TaxID=28202 RepID=A0AAX4HJY8_9BACT|nr:hypothetical protein [Peredibacter starrii]WPU63543.1 hypothetical protein SOO65_12675 [Peredibacter starrii]
MKVLAQLITFVMIVLSITFLKTSIDLPKVEKQQSAGIELVLDLADDMADPEAEDDSNEIEFHETEYFLSSQKFIFPQEVGTHLFLDDYPTFFHSYINSIYVPPLTHSLS